MIKNTSISEVYIYSKFSKIRQIRITNPELKPIKDPKPPTIVPVEPKIVTITSTWIGTLHLNNSKTGKPYVEIDQIIETGDIVCHVTSLLLETEIKSEISGKVIEILREDKSIIDFGKAIILIEEI